MASSVISVDNQDKESLLSANDYIPGKKSASNSPHSKLLSGVATFNPADAINKQI